MIHIGKIIFSFSTLCILSLTVVSAQCGKEKPYWTNSYYKELQNSYLETVIVVGNSQEEVREKAKNEIIKRRGLTVGARVSFSEDETKNRGLTVASKVISEYWECNGVYTAYFLFQTLKNPSKIYDQVEVTSDYSFSARAFIPGMAQIHKGHKAKGLMFICGEIALVGGIVAFEGLRSSYGSKINTTHNADSKQSYIDKSNNMQNLRNGFIAGAAALYIWNVIDGIVGKGRKHVVIGQTNVQFLPFAIPDAGGLSLAINF